MARVSLLDRGVHQRVLYIGRQVRLARLEAVGVDKAYAH
jgi:hypothetical protein